MKTRTFLSSTLALTAFALTPSPALAQDEDEQVEMAEGDETGADELGQAMAMLSGLFPVEPLTADQEARLPLAQNIIAKMIPEGTLGEMMEGMMGDMLGPIMEMGPKASTTTVADRIGVTAFELEMDDEQAAEIASIFDPAWKERSDRQAAIMPEMMREMMTAMEPGMRKAMSELYAINFSATELTEIDAFFSTETGANFARKSFTMASDPRVMSASMEALPQMMGQFANLEARMVEVAADLPEQRNFADLSDAEKARIAEATGFTVDEIESNLSMSEIEWDEEAAEEASEDASS
ncbi:DUF2059 domain-containing protein [Erythrobacter sp. F6033]|uniref:DUF2059 domain-containing protein n=1 Tax=Erythrobacter sp. F6033 TaxID=2926401 RepID=UPI001FF45098|nr:DUF2059 domain-containing protein [Erythrobacter sp. F6033]MCK0127033.1 DUF2059 domain-containing protein [Erythrobacter sp. F6033]